MIDFCFEDNKWDIDTIYYLKDNAGQYYITEVQKWIFHQIGGKRNERYRQSG